MLAKMNGFRQVCLKYKKETCCFVNVRIVYGYIAEKTLIIRLTLAPYLMFFVWFQSLIKNASN